MDNTEQGTSEPPEPTPDRDVAERSCHVEVACHERCIADDAASFDAFDGEPDPDGEALTGWLRNRMCQIAEHAGVHTGTVSIAIVDDAAMAGLHREHLGKSGPTDVLTFDLSEGAAPGRPVDVDIVINHDEAARRAARRGHDTALELLLYAVHGLLHVSGHDDRDPVAAVRMHRREDELLVLIGLPPAYGEAPPSSTVGNAT